MADIRDQKLFYHLTSLENIPSIFSEGLKARTKLVAFRDVADHQIIEKRRSLGLEVLSLFIGSQKTLSMVACK